jgi:hypothetical protein
VVRGHGASTEWHATVGDRGAVLDNENPLARQGRTFCESDR